MPRCAARRWKNFKKPETPRCFTRSPEKTWLTSPGTKPKTNPESTTESSKAKLDEGHAVIATDRNGPARATLVDGNPGIQHSFEPQRFDLDPVSCCLAQKCRGRLSSPKQLRDSLSVHTRG